MANVKNECQNDNTLSAGTAGVQNKRGLTARYSAITIFFYLAVSLSGYIPVFLQENGYTGTQIGTIISVACLISAVSLPVWGLVSDKIGSARKTLVICIVVYTATFLFIPSTLKVFMGPILLSTVLVVISKSFTGPCINLLVGWTVWQATLNKINYSSIRLWGSAGFAVMMILLSFILPHTGTNLIFYLSPVMAAIMIAAFLTVPEYGNSENKTVTVNKLKPGRVFRNYYFMIYLVMVVGMVLYDAITIIYMPFLIKSVNAPSTSTALVLGIRALFEMVMMLAAVRFKKHFPLPILLIAAGCMFALEHMLYGAAGNLTQILLLSMLSGAANGFYLGFGPSYVLSIVPPELNNTAQTLCGSVSMGTAIAGSFIGGILMDRVGVTTLFFGCGLVILFITIFFAVSIAVGRKAFAQATPQSVYMPIGRAGKR